MKKGIYEIIRFAIVGCIATLIQFVVYYLLVSIVSHNIALLVSYLVSLCINFLLTTFFTFKVKPGIKKGIGFISSHLINMACQFLFLNFFIWLGISKQWAIIPTIALCFPISYILVRISMKRL